MEEIYLSSKEDDVRLVEGWGIVRYAELVRDRIKRDAEVCEGCGAKIGRFEICRDDCPRVAALEAEREAEWAREAEAVRTLGVATRVRVTPKAAEVANLRPGPGAEGVVNMVTPRDDYEGATWVVWFGNGTTALYWFEELEKY